MGFLPNIVMGDSGSPLMTGITYLLLLECASIVFLSLPFHLKFRRTLSEVLVTSPKYVAQVPPLIDSDDTPETKV